MLEQLAAFADRGLRRFGLVPSEVPTTEELERLSDARARVRLVIQVRWMVLGVLALYGLYAIFFYRQRGLPELSAAQKAIPVAAFLLTAAYNGWYHATYRWFARIRHLNLVQLLLDLALVTVIVHFSGGAVSWFWAVYPVLILEAAFLGDRVSDAWILGVASSLLYGALLTSEFYRLIPPVEMPFENSNLQGDFHYVMLKWAWVSVLCLVTSGIGAHMMRKIRRQEQTLRDMVITDGLTRLYNRSYFYLRLNSEIQRGKRYGRRCSLLLLDVDDFKRFNDTYGHQAGDELLRGVADVLKRNVRVSDTFPRYSVDLPCRIGGEEFAILLPESSVVEGGQTAERLRREVEAGGAAAVAERLRREIAALDVAGRQVTVSIGVAAFPENGEDPDSLVRAADGAMYRAKAGGKNRVELAPPAEDGPPPATQPAGSPGPS